MDLKEIYYRPKGTM